MNPRATPSHRSRRGSVLIVAMLITAMLALVLGSYFNLSLTSSRQTRRTFDRDTAFHLAEAGIEEAVWSYNQKLAGSSAAWTDWNTDGVAAWKKFTDFTLTTSSTGSVKVYASTTAPTATAKPVVVAESTVQTGTANPVTQMIQVTLRRRSFFANGLTARNQLLFRGTNTSFDSWDSDPDRDPATSPVDYGTTTRNDRGGIASASVDSTAALINHASIYGYVSTGGASPQVGNDGVIGAFGSAPGTVDAARVATDFNASLPAVAAPADGTWISPLVSTLGSTGTTTRWRTPAITLSGKQTLTILGNVILVVTAAHGETAISLTGQAGIIIPAGSSLTIYTAGDIKAAGNGVANANVQPVAFQIWGTDATDAGQSITLAGNGSLKAVIYAPCGDVSLNGNGDMMGAVTARNITLTGNAAFHYDAALSAFSDNAPYGPDGWRLLGASERQAKASLFQSW